MLKTDNTALVLVDIQGKLATLMYERERLFENLVRITRGAQTLGLPVLWNEQLPNKLGETIPQLKEVLGDREPLIKSVFSCWGNLDFQQALRTLNVKNVLLCGIETHICVYQSAVDLLDVGYDVHLVVDAVSSRFEYNYQLGLDRCKDAGAQLTSAEMALFEMMQVAEGDTFREIVKIIK